MSTKIMNSVARIIAIFCLHLLASIHCFQEPVNAESNIYGVRWFLAQSFRYKQSNHMPIDNNTEEYDLMAMFNSQKYTQGTHYFISVQDQVFPCQMKSVNVEITENFHSTFNKLSSKIGETFRTFVYRCPIDFRQQNYLQNHNFFQYKIWSEFQKQQTSVFGSTLKSPKFRYGDLKAVVLGDWGLITKQSEYYIQLANIEQCLSSRIKEDNINLMILLGDLGYDLQGQTYINFLTYLQAVSKNVAILFTPGNHQSMKHKNIYQLSVETFYSPFWNNFYGYYQLVNIGRYIFIGYSPDSQFSTSLYTELFLQKQGKHHQFFQKQLSEQLIADIYANFTTIVFSHYPIFCSQQNEYDYCSLYQSRQDPYLQIFKKIGIDLMLSAHLHLYQRSKPICFHQSDFLEANGSQEIDVYELKSCPVFVVDGAAGNGYFVMTERIFELKNFSKKFVGNTGFGILTLSTQTSTNKLQFQQISAKRSCGVQDHFIMKSKMDNQNEGKQPLVEFTVIFLGVIGTAFLVFFGYFVWHIIKAKDKCNDNQASNLNEKTGSSWELEDIKY